MERKKKPTGLLITGFISALASLAIVAVAPSFAEKPDKTGSEQASSDTDGSDRKDNSSARQDTSRGKPASSSSDDDGDVDSDSSTTYTEDNDTNDDGTPNNVADDGDNAHPSGKDRSVENGKSGNQGNSESDPDDDGRGPDRSNGGADKPNGSGGTDLADQDGNNGCGNDDDFEDDNEGLCGGKKRNDSTPPVEDDEDEVEGDNTTKTCPAGQSMNEDGTCGKVEGGRTEQCPAGTVMGSNDKCESPPPPCDKDNNMANGVQACEEDEDEVQPGLEENPSNPDEDVLGGRIDQDEASAQPEQAPSVLGIRLSQALNKPLKIAGAQLPFTGGDVMLFLLLALGLFASGMVLMRSGKAKAHQS